MKRKKESKSFKAWRTSLETKQSINECSWFALILGLVLTVRMGIQSVCTTGSTSIIYLILTGVGAALFLIGGFCPLILRRPFQILKSAFNTIGITTVRLLLIPLYLLFMVLSLLAQLKDGNKSGFYSWQNSQSGLPDSAFASFKEQVVPSQTATTLHSLNNIIHVFAEHKLLFLLPLVAILLTIGLLFFFISAHSVFSLVYTLF